MSLSVVVDSKGSDFRPIDQLIERERLKHESKRRLSKSSWPDSESDVDHLKSMNDSQMMAMLGITDLHGKSIMSSFFYREDVCSVCGTIHSRPDLLDMYYSCRKCQSVLREPKLLRFPFHIFDTD